MSRIKKVLIFTTVAIVCIIALFIGQVIYLAHPTKGRIIDQYENPKQAVLVIDIQEDFTGTTAKAPFPYKDSESLIRTVNAITEAAFARNMMIVYIKQELDGLMGKMLSHLLAGGVAIRGNPGTEIDKRIFILSDAIFPKPRSDAFSNPELGKFLMENQVNELYLVGLDADGCVHVTAQGALNRGYRVNIITDAVVLKDEDRWEELLAEYRQEGIQLMLSEEFLTGKSLD